MGGTRASESALCGFAVWIAISVLVSGVASAADCVATPARALEFEVLSCRPAGVVIDEEIAGTRLWWLRPYLDSIAEANPGVIVRGRVLRSRSIERGEASSPWQVDGEEKDLFFTSSDPDFCGAFDGVDTAMVLEEKPCCEIVPPANVACVLDVWEARSLGPDLRRAVDEPSPAQLETAAQPD